MRCAATILVLLAPVAAGQTCVVERISVDVNGFESDGASTQPVMSLNGRFVAFVSTATNLVPGDTNGVGDVFLRDLQLGTIERVSVGPGGVECTHSCSYPAVSDDGRYVAFNTATALVASDTNNALDVYLRDRLQDTVELVSIGASGALGDGPSFGATMSGDTRYVLYTSWATNLVPGDTNAVRDIFLRDRLLGTTERISVTSTGGEGSDSSGSSTLSSYITPDGRHVVFGSIAPNFVAGDTNNDQDVFVRDRVTSTTSLLVQAPGGGVPSGGADLYSMTRNGRYVGFVSSASDLVPGDTNGMSDAFVLDRTTGVVERVNITHTGVESIGSAWAPVASEDGRIVLFSTAAPDIVAYDPNDKREVFRRDRAAGRSERFVPNALAAPPGQDLFAAVMSGDGQSVAFSYIGEDITVVDTNSASDIYIIACTFSRAICVGDGSAAACPCGNVGAEGAGCANSMTNGATLSAVGSPRASDDTLTLFVQGLPTHTTLRFMVGTHQANGDAGLVAGDGLRCLAGTINYLGTRMTSEGESSWGFGVPGAPLLSTQSPMPFGGDVRYYQVLYRNAATFCGPLPLNWSNGLEVTWSP